MKEYDREWIKTNNNETIVYKKLLTGKEACIIIIIMDY